MQRIGILHFINERVIILLADVVSNGDVLLENGCDTLTVGAC